MVRGQPSRKAKTKPNDDADYKPKGTTIISTKPQHEYTTAWNNFHKGNSSSVPEKRTTRAGATTATLIVQEEAIVPSGVLPLLESAWQVNPKMAKKRIHFIFDAVAPYVEYKRGEKFAIDKDFPTRGDVTPRELTDSQGNDVVKEWMAYAPREYMCVLNHPTNSIC